MTAGKRRSQQILKKLFTIVEQLQTKEVISFRKSVSNSIKRKKSLDIKHFSIKNN